MPKSEFRKLLLPEGKGKSETAFFMLVLQVLCPLYRELRLLVHFGVLLAGLNLRREDATGASPGCLHVLGCEGAVRRQRDFVRHIDGLRLLDEFILQKFLRFKRRVQY